MEEQIKGVTFRDYACASANIVAGMPIEKVCDVLGVEQAVWAEVQEGWNNKMAELPMEAMSFYGEVFTNPKQGKFANVEGAAAGPEEVLAKYPEWSDTIKMEKYMEHASNVGIEIDFEKEFGISLAEYSQLGAHWSKYYKENVADVQTRSSEQILNDEWDEAQIKAGKIFTEHGELRDKWDAYYTEKYKDQSAGLSDDIDF